MSPRAPRRTRTTSIVREAWCAVVLATPLALAVPPARAAPDARPPSPAAPVLPEALAAPPPAGFVPHPWDPARRPERAETASPARALRVLTDDDYPPFHFVGPDGALTGFNVELMRALCEDLRAACTVQARRWDTLLDALDRGEGDVAAASLALSDGNRRRADFTLPVYRTPARFVARAGAAPLEVSPRGLANARVAVARGSAHEAFLRAFFPLARALPALDLDAARALLRGGDADLVFGDGVALALVLAGEAGEGLAFSGGPYTESRYFGEGVGLAVRRGDGALRRTLDEALMRLVQSGVYDRLYLKYHPVGAYDPAP